MKILGTNLANAYVLQCGAIETENILQQAYKDITENDSYKLFDVLHHYTSGMKVIAGEWTYNGIDELRQSCGGAGFLDTSSIAAIWYDIAPFPTFEGVNVIMLQQSSRYLFKMAEKASRGKQCEGLFSYINKTESLCSAKSQAKTIDQFLDLDHIRTMLQTRAAACLRQVFTAMQ